MKEERPVRAQRGKSELGQSLVDRALILTRERILSGEYEPGARLRLNQLAEESGVSLIPVREALRVLEGERLVEMAPNKGARVAPLSIDDMRELYATRILIETKALKMGRPIRPDEASALNQMLDKLSKNLASSDRSAALNLHREFHFALYALAESRWLSYLIDILWKHAERYQRLSVPLRSDRGHEEHSRILEALLEGKRAVAARALRTHLEHTARLVEEGYRGAPGSNGAPRDP